MLVNKWIQFGLSAAGGLLALSASLDWSTVVTPQVAASITTGIMVLKAVLNTLQPAAGAVVTPTKGVIVTHN